MTYRSQFAGPATRTTLHSHRLLGLTLLALVLVLCATSPVLAGDGAEAPLLFRSAAGTELPGESHHRGETPLALDVEILTTNPSHLRLELPDGSHYTVERLRWTTPSEGQAVWYGNFRSPSAPPGIFGSATGETAGFVHLLYIEGRVAGNLRTPDGRHYRLTTTADGDHRLAELDPEASSGCALDGPINLSNTSRPFIPGAHSVLTGEATAALCDPPASTRVIDLMVLYHPSFIGNGETTVRDSIAAKVSEANTIFLNSDVKIRYNLIHRGPVTQDPQLTQADPGVVNTARYLGRTSSAEVDKLRDDHGADMVAILLPNNGVNPCGAAVLPHQPGSTEVQQSWGGAFIEDAFMAYEYQCGDSDFTFAHELGHNLGMQHDRGDPFHSPTPVEDFAYGYLFQGWGGPGATLMGCKAFSIRPGGVCHRVLYVSNPGKFLEGGVLGEPITASNGGSFNACLANLRAASYAAFRSRPTDALPTLQITSPAMGATLEIAQDYTLSATASDAEDGPLGGAVQWRSDLDGALGTGASLNKSLHTVGSHVLTASVSDSTGKTSHHSIRVTVVDTQPPRRWTDVPAHDQTLSGPNALVRGWAIDPSRVASMKFFVDGGQVSLTALDTATFRPDVCAAYPDLEDPDCNDVGWQGELNTTAFSNGIHYFKITATDTEGNESTLLSRRFRVSNVNVVSVSPVADAFVYQLYPDSNYGTLNALSVRGETNGFGMHTYLKFSVSGVTAPVTKATLRLRTGPKAIPGATGYRIGTTTWGENTITFNNSPRDSLGSVNMGFMPANTWIERDVTHLVSGNGTYTFGIAAWNHDLTGMYFQSRHTNYPPSLILEY